eukprot:11178878-Lingulodinium_polyedra.AAC.1
MLDSVFLGEALGAVPCKKVVRRRSFCRRVRCALGFAPDASLVPVSAMPPPSGSVSATAASSVARAEFSSVADFAAD